MDKPGYKTTEFWLTVAANILPLLMPGLPPQWQVIVQGAATVAYTLSRTIVKAS